MADQPPPAAKPRSRTLLIIQTTVSLVLVVAIFYYLLKGIDLRLVWAEIRAMSWTEDAVLALIGAWNLATYAFVWMSVTPGLSFGRAMVMTQAATAVTNTVPTVGPAIGVGLTYQMLGPRGYSRSQPWAAHSRRPCGVFRGLDNAATSQQGRRVGLSCPIRRAMDLPVDESTPAATQWLQQALKQGAGGRLGLTSGGPDDRDAHRPAARQRAAETGHPHRPGGLLGGDRGRHLRLRHPQVRQLRGRVGSPAHPHRGAAWPAGRRHPVQPAHLLAAADGRPARPHPRPGRGQQPDHHLDRQHRPGRGGCPVGRRLLWDAALLGLQPGRDHPDDRVDRHLERL